MSLRTLLAVVASPAMRMTLSKVSLPLLPEGRRRGRCGLTDLSPAHTSPQVQQRPLAVPLPAHDVVGIALIGDIALPKTYVAANGVGLSAADGAGGTKWSAPSKLLARWWSLVLAMAATSVFFC